MRVLLHNVSSSSRTYFLRLVMPSYAKMSAEDERRGEQGKDKSQETRSLRFLLRGDCQSATPSLENVLHLPSSVLQLVQGVGKRGEEG